MSQKEDDILELTELLDESGFGNAEKVKGFTSEEVIGVDELDLELEQLLEQSEREMREKSITVDEKNEQIVGEKDSEIDIDREDLESDSSTSLKVDSGFTEQDDSVVEQVSSTEEVSLLEDAFDPEPVGSEPDFWEDKQAAAPFASGQNFEHYNELEASLQTLREEHTQLEERLQRLESANYDDFNNDLKMIRKQQEDLQTRLELLEAGRKEDIEELRGSLQDFIVQKIPAAVAAILREEIAALSQKIED